MKLIDKISWLTGGVQKSLFFHLGEFTVYGGHPNGSEDNEKGISTARNLEKRMIEVACMM